MPKSRYAKVKRNPKKSTAGESYTAPAMYGDNRSETVRAAINSVDQVARTLEQRWGIGKLERLAPPKLAVAVEQARQNFSAAAQGDDSNYLVQKANNLIEGWKALEKVALKNGHKPADAKVWYFVAPEDAGGKPYAIVDHASDTAAVDMDAVERVYSLDEICRIIKQFESTKLGTMTAAVKDHFPNAKITKTKHQKENPNDPIPF